MTFTEQLRSMGACSDAIKWVNGRSLRKCWQVADRSDWMLWLVGVVGIDRKTLVLAACDCAETALKYVPKGEDRPRKALEAVRAWCDGGATLSQVRYAADAAADADADAAAAAYAAAYAAYAAYAADADADAAAADAAAAYAAYAAAYAAAAADAAKAHKTMCRIIRKRIPVDLVEVAIGGAQ